MKAEFNADLWLKLENGILQKIDDGNYRATIFTGPVLRSTDTVLRGVQIPESFWKIVVMISPDSKQISATAYVLDRGDVAQKDVKEVGEMTGLDFGPIIMPTGGLFNALNPHAPFFEPIDSFVGREDLITKLHDHFEAKTNARAALIGMPGIGKTRLAIELAHRLRDLFPGGVFWLATEQTESRTQQFYNIAKHLVPGTVSFDELAKQGTDFATLVRQAWPQGHPKALWILDNLPEPDGNQSAVSWRSWCPVPDSVCALITSRRLVTGVGNRNNHHLSALHQNAAIELLTYGINPKPDDQNALAAIVKWTCYHPLTIETLNRVLREKVLRLRHIKALIDKPISAQDETWISDVLDLVPKGEVSKGALSIKPEKEGNIRLA